MHRATPLPDTLLDRPFRVAEALALGMTPKRLRSNDVWAPYRGVRVRCALEWTPRLRARSGLLVCPPGTLVTGFDALAVAGLPLPFSEERLLERRLAVAAPVSTDPFTHDQLDVEWMPVPQHLPRVLDEGVLRLEDADLWLRLVLRHHLDLTASYRGRLGTALLGRWGGDPGPALTAVERLAPALRTAGRAVLAEAVAQPLAGWAGGQSA